MSLEELEKKRRQLRAQSDKTFANMDAIVNESYRVADVARNSREILEDIDTKFESYTGLKKIDIAFLFVATALQVVCQYVLTQFPERSDNQTAAKNTKGHVEEHSNRCHRYYNPSLEEICSNPVPFDANIGANGALAGGKQMGHRVTALGHDPILGLVIGTANIATSTLTNRKLQSYHIYTNKMGRDYFRNNADTGLIFKTTGEKLLNDGIEGKKIVGVSLLKEIVHLNSDLNTKNSLPIPIVSAIDAGFAADLAKSGLDMSNAIAIGKQASFSILVNTLVSMLHGLFYDESVDYSRSVYEIRTRKILSYSNFIASASNLIYVGSNVACGNEVALKSLDIGGLIVTIYRIATDTFFMRKLKQEFIKQEFLAQIRGSEYDFN